MTLTRRHVLAGMVGFGALAAFPAHAQDMLRLSGRAFGTSWSLLLPRHDSTNDPTGDIASILDDVDTSMSPFRSDSELSAFNSGPSGAFAVSPGFARVTSEALRLANISNGAFDPTVGPLVGRYGFGPIEGDRNADFTALSCSENVITKSISTLSLDLCGIAKGYALDAIANHLRARDHGDFLIEIGGELLASGMGPENRPWRLGITNPVRGDIHTAFAATNMAIATSGDAINAYYVGGRRYSHTIDPTTNEPIRNAIASVTVAHASAMTADGLATALLVLGPQAGAEWAEAQNLPALFLLRNRAGGLDTVVTSQFKDQFLS